MKKILTIAASLFLVGGILSAQDMQKATELAKQANEDLINQNYENALTGFREALAEAENCEDGADLVATCEGVIPDIIYRIGNNLLNINEFDLGIEKFNEAIEAARKYNVDEVVEKATKQISQAYLKKGAENLNKKSYEAACSDFDKSLEYNPENAIVYIYKGQALMKLNRFDEAETIFAQAAEKGKADEAMKQLKNMAQIKMQNAYVAKDYKKAAGYAYDFIQAYGPDARAYQFAILSAKNTNDINNMVKYFDELCQAFPDSKDIAKYALQIGASYYSAKNYAKAKEYFQTAATSTDATVRQNAKQYLDVLNSQQ